MIVAGVPYSAPELLTTTQGGTPYGPAHTAGPNADQLITGDEATICCALGWPVVEVVAKLA